VDPHDQPDLALGRVELSEKKGKEEEEGDGHVKEEITEKGDDEVAVPETPGTAVLLGHVSMIVR
jgi:hypothetical protein